MQSISLEIPEEVLISLKMTPENFSKEFLILVAVKLFEMGKLSAGKAAHLAGISKVEFLLKIGDYQVSPFALSSEELEQDVDNA